MDGYQNQPWMDHYRAAMLEADLSQLNVRIRLAEEAIVRRKEAIGSSPDTRAEIQALSDAQQNLRVLKRELATPQKEDGHSHPELEGTYVVFVSRDRRYIAITNEVCQLLGYSREELLAKRIDDVAAPELRQAVPDTFDEYVQQGHMQGEYVLLHNDGRRIPILFEALVFPDGCMTARWHPLKK